ncbi:MAG: hypothetical protein PVH61_22995 [Candidatus Aminicenantes bacterium]|jgi:outer membrane lipoprotein-sorting protein
MKKISLVCVLSLLLLSLETSYGSSQPVEKILEKMIAAQGGKEKLASIKDSTVSGTLEMIPMSSTGPITVYWKKSCKRRADIELMGIKITQAYDGKLAWMINPQAGDTPQEMPEKFSNALKRQALGYNALLNPGKYGINFTLKGKEKIKDKDYLVLVQTYADGQTATLYIDPGTYLTYKVKSTSFNQMGAEVEAESFLSDYKEVNGIMVAHTIKTSQAGQDYMKVTLKTVSYNSGLEDSLFQMNQ